MTRITIIFLLLTIIGCATVECEQEEKPTKKAPHKYGGWYCPDNLNGFPPVDIYDWKNVAVVSGRLPTKEETQNGISLMYIDIEEYPTAKALDIELPKLATYYNEYTNKNQYVIIIQTIDIDGDSIVGFRYLNGGNGSARFNEVEFLSAKEIESVPSSNFVSHSIKINATQDEIWRVLTEAEYLKMLQPTFIGNVFSVIGWREQSNINYYYPLSGVLTSAFADKLFGSYYVQNDYLIDGNPYVEKFLLLENKEENYTKLKIVCGPFQNDFETQQKILQNWAKKVKELSQK
ncbi:MAG: hypothetical protein HQ521_10620 [Bacteroidetes bacterium]|nr:hypothetical protein [Bacteroidota bacterium]